MDEISAREAFSRFKPEQCVFVISIDKNKKPSGMVAGWQMKCSSDPPLYAVALSKKGNTGRLVRESGEFVVAVPNKRLEAAVELFGSASGRDVDKFAQTRLKTERAKHVTAPLLTDATLNFECKLEKEVDAGDHTIFIGRVVAAYGNKHEGVLMNMGKKGKKRYFQEF